MAQAPASASAFPSHVLVVAVWLSGAYDSDRGTFICGEEEFKFKFGMLN
jgi:hypothetical protein